MVQRIAPDDPRLTYEGSISLLKTPQWVAPWRIPYQEAPLFFPNGYGKTGIPSGVGRAAMPSGVRIVLKSDTTLLAGTFEADPPPSTLREPAEIPRLDLSINGTLWETIEQGDTGSFQFLNLPAGEKTLALWLPHYNQFRLCSLQISDGATLEPVHDTRPRWLIFGDSTTQGRGAASPSQIWPALFARSCGFHLVSLAMGDGCHLQVMFARLMRDLDADLLTICVGGNIYERGSLNAYSFRSALIGFIQIVREKHPETPFVVISPIYTPSLEQRPGPGGLSFQGIREEIQTALAILREAGDRHVYYLDGRALFGPEHVHLFLPEKGDLLHPGAEGYRACALNFEEWYCTHIAPFYAFPSRKV
uniref:Lipase n=1 Tax=Thermosporothrix sp. COM3 TaxID=2490863 RepID=A0A455SLE6_9CHLR|nr:lipase [Thermosporothrix sp. COM3]